MILLIPGQLFAGDRIDIISPDKETSTGRESEYILDAAWCISDPYGEMSPELGAAAALNRALSLVFSGHASPEVIRYQRLLAEDREDDGITWAGFASDVLQELQIMMPDSFPEAVELDAFDLAPSEVPYISPDNPHLVVIRYDDEEYLERLLQRLYFKLIQGPVLITVPYRGDAESIPQEFRDWNNFIYGSNENTMLWDDTRLVYVDWELTQTVVLQYEDGQIACYDSGRKYYIDHTAAVAAAGAMMAHPDFARFSINGASSYVLTPAEI